MRVKDPHAFLLALTNVRHVTHCSVSRSLSCPIGHSLPTPHLFIPNICLTPTHLQACGGFREIVQLLSDADPSTLTKQTHMGFTALHRAAAYGFLDICKDLVERAPALVNIRTLSGDSALDIALRAGNRAKAVTAYLQQVGKRRSVCGVVWWWIRVSDSIVALSRLIPLSQFM